MNKTTLILREQSDLGGDEEREVSISINKAELDIYEIIDFIIIPVLKGMGYSESTIDEVIISE